MNEDKKNIAACVNAWNINNELSSGCEVFVVEKEHPELGVRKVSEIPTIDYLNIVKNASNDYNEEKFAIWKLVPEDEIKDQEQEDI